MWVYLNDRFVPKEEAVVSVFDHGFLYGDGVFETLRAYRGRIFQLTEHLARLERSASELGMALPATRERLADLVRESLTRNPISESRSRAGPARSGSTRPSVRVPRWSSSPSPLNRILNRSTQTECR